MTRIKIICEPDEIQARKIRQLFCQVAINKTPYIENHLIETNFNELLAEIVQTAFDEGFRFKFPSKTIGAV